MGREDSAVITDRRRQLQPYGCEGTVHVWWMRQQWGSRVVKWMLLLMGRDIDGLGMTALGRGDGHLLLW